jgi:hypothetical protein
MHSQQETGVAVSLKMNLYFIGCVAKLTRGLFRLCITYGPLFGDLAV